MGNTSIQWTDKTWNPVRGCSRVSEGCRNCYAERQAARFAVPGSVEAGSFVGFVTKVNGHPAWTGKVELIESKVLEPLSWKEPQRIFVNSMSDLFHEGLPDEAIDRVFATMALCPQHTFQLLTKRPERMQRYLSAEDWPERVEAFMWEIIEENVDPLNRRSDDLRAIAQEPADDLPLPNVWLGVSVEDRGNKNRIDLLRETPAAVRFLSIEPLLEDIGELDLCGISWVIVGGESGPGARSFQVDWARQIVKQCRAAGVPCFVKQLGAHPVDRNDAGFEGDTPTSWPMDTKTTDVTNEGGQGSPVWIHLRDSKGGDPLEWPLDLRLRQFPLALERAA